MLTARSHPHREPGAVLLDAERRLSGSQTKSSDVLRVVKRNAARWLRFRKAVADPTDSNRPRLCQSSALVVERARRSSATSKRPQWSYGEHGTSLRVVTGQDQGGGKQWR